MPRSTAAHALSSRLAAAAGRTSHACAEFSPRSQFPAPNPAESCSSTAVASSARVDSSFRRSPRREASASRERERAAASAERSVRTSPSSPAVL